MCVIREAASLAGIILSIICNFLFSSPFPSFQLYSPTSHRTHLARYSSAALRKESSLTNLVSFVLHDPVQRHLYLKQINKKNSILKMLEEINDRACHEGDQRETCWVVAFKLKWWHIVKEIIRWKNNQKERLQMNLTIGLYSIKFFSVFFLHLRLQFCWFSRLIFQKLYWLILLARNASA